MVAAPRSLRWGSVRPTHRVQHTNGDAVGATHELLRLRLNAYGRCTHTLEGTNIVSGSPAERYRLTGKQ